MHQPGKSNFTDKRGQNKGPTMLKEDKPPTPYFSKDFIPARGFALIECRFVGTSSTIHIPDEVHGQQQFAIVRAMGPGKHHFNGTVIEPDYKEGDFVYAAIAQGRKVEFEDKKLVLVGTEYIFGKFPNVPQAVIDEFAREAEKEKKPEPTIINGAAP